MKNPTIAAGTKSSCSVTRHHSRKWTQRKKKEIQHKISLKSDFLEETLLPWKDECVPGNEMIAQENSMHDFLNFFP